MPWVVMLTPNEEYYSVPPVPTVSNCEVLTGGTGGTPVHSTTIGLFFRVRGWIAELSTWSDTKRIYEGRYGYNFILCRNQYIYPRRDLPIHPHCSRTMSSWRQEQNYQRIYINKEQIFHRTIVLVDCSPWLVDCNVCKWYINHLCSRYWYIGWCTQIDAIEHNE